MSRGSIQFLLECDDDVYLSSGSSYGQLKRGEIVKMMESVDKGESTSSRVHTYNIMRERKREIGRKQM